MPTIRSILIPTDFSPSSRTAVAQSLLLAKRLGAEAELLHVCPVLVHAMAPGAAPEDPRFQAELQSRLQTDLDALAAEHRGAGVQLRSELLLGNPAREIAARAERGGFDLVVMVTHGRSGVERLMMGSVTEGVLRHCSVPVLTFRPEHTD